MLQRSDQDQVEHLGHGQGEERDLHRRLDVLLGIEARRQHLDQDDTKQAHGIGDQCPLGHQGVMGIEATVLEQGNGQRLGQQRQGSGTGHHQQETQPQPPVEQPRILLAVGLGIGTRQGWQQDGPQGHAKHPRG